MSVVGHEYKLCELTLLILRHLNHEEENFDASFHICICEKDIFQPRESFVVQALCFFFFCEKCILCLGGICHLFG